jgi:Domain of unknown function (DUF1844)
MSEQKSGFTVTDRRSFSSTGETKEPSATPPPPEEAPAAKEAEAPRRALPPVDFGTFVLSLGSSTIMHLGELPEEEGGAPRKDLPLAKHTIDILSMLQAKTKGNLTAQEDKLLESLLYDLRLRYVQASKS